MCIYQYIHQQMHMSTCMLTYVYSNIYINIFIHQHIHQNISTHILINAHILEEITRDEILKYYGVATLSRLLQILGLFCRI